MDGQTNIAVNTTDDRRVTKKLGKHRPSMLVDVCRCFCRCYFVVVVSRCCGCCRKPASHKTPAHIIEEDVLRAGVLHFSPLAGWISFTTVSDRDRILRIFWAFKTLDYGGQRLPYDRLEVEAKWHVWHAMVFVLYDYHSQAQQQNRIL